MQRDKMDARPQPLLAGATAPSPLNCLFCFFLICSLSLQTRRHFRSPTPSLSTMFSRKTRSTAFQAGFFEELLRSCTSRSGSAETQEAAEGFEVSCGHISHKKKDISRCSPPILSHGKSNRMGKRCNFALLCSISMDQKAEM